MFKLGINPSLNDSIKYSIAMIFDRFIKTYEIQTSKSISEIIDEINYRGERQQGKKILLISEPVNYSNAIIDENSIIFKRNSSVISRLKGNGVITFLLKPSFHGTRIICTVDPTLINILKDIGFVAALLIYLTYTVFKNVRELHFNTFIILAVIWTFVISIGYFSLNFNTKSLESYSKTILYDLGLMTPDEEKKA